MPAGIHLLVSGRVQGVGYRAWFAERAQAAGLVGWVRNRRAGSVEAFISGNLEGVAALLAAAWDGPPAAKVTSVDKDEVDDDPVGAGEGGFIVLPTV